MRCEENLRGRSEYPITNTDMVHEISHRSERDPRLTQEACYWITRMLGFNPSNIVGSTSTPRVQHPNHELCHCTDDVTQHVRSTSAPRA